MFGVQHRHVEDLRGRVGVDASRALALIVVFLFILAQFFEDEGIVMGVKHFEGRLGIVDLVLGLDGTDLGLELDQGRIFVTYEDDLAHSPEVGEDVVETVVVVLLRQGSNEKHPRGTIFLQELLAVGVDYRLGLPAVDLGTLLPHPELLALHRYFPELLIDIDQIVDRTVLLGAFGRVRVGLVLG